MTPKQTVEKAIEKIKKSIKKHKHEMDPDGFSVCAIENEKNMVVAPKGEWLGTEESRCEAIKAHKKTLKRIGCDVCDSLNESFTALKSIQKSLDDAVDLIKDKRYYKLKTRWIDREDVKHALGYEGGKH